MKEVWVMYERSDLERKKGNYDWQNYDTQFRVFNDFNVAKKAFLDRIAWYGMQESSLFDGDGTLNNIDMDDYLDQLSYDDESEKVQAFFRNVIKAFRQLCRGQEIDITLLDDGKANSWSYDVDVYREADGNPVLSITPQYDGPINCINPYIHTNAFVMNNEDKDYNFYIEDMFKEISFVSHLFIDLKKVMVE
jgi:hypothetical protein